MDNINIHLKKKKCNRFLSKSSIFFLICRLSKTELKKLKRC